MSDQSVKIKLQKFEGPLELLMYLIRSSELDIYDIPIAEITAQYLEYLDMMARLDLNVASEFVVMASHLIYIKSKMMLPDEYGSEEEEEVDYRAALVEQLLEYQKYKEASEELQQKGQEATRLMPRPPQQLKLDYEQETVWHDVSLFELLRTFSRIISYIPDDYLYQIAPETITVSSRIDELKKLFESSREMSFSDLFYNNMKKYELIVTFLAVLELMKTRFLLARQEELFGEITLLRSKTESQD
jgi:segregation and condensation protein A